MKRLTNHISLICIALVIALGLGTPAYAKQVKEKKTYYLYGDAKSGTKFKQKIFSSDVPFDVSYDELTPALKERVKAPYGGLKESEHPPFPKAGTEKIYRQLYKANLQIEREGEVLAIAMVDATGGVESVSVYKAPNQNMAQMINYILANTSFDPATCDGEPCKMEYLFETKLEQKPSWAR